MKKIKVKDLLYLTGGCTKVNICEAPPPNYEFHELWRGVVDCIDWGNVPYGDRYVEHVSVVNGEDWLQILI